MLDLIVAAAAAACFFSAIIAAHFVFCLALFVVYRMDGGKMGLWAYLNEM